MKCLHAMLHANFIIRDSLESMERKEASSMMKISRPRCRMPSTIC